MEMSEFFFPLVFSCTLVNRVIPFSVSHSIVQSLIYGVISLVGVSILVEGCLPSPILLSLSTCLHFPGGTFSRFLALYPGQATRRCFWRLDFVAACMCFGLSPLSTSSHTLCTSPLSDCVRQRTG
jgi:hypothetical protein